MNQAGNTATAGKPTTEIDALMYSIDEGISQIIGRLHALDTRINGVMSPPAPCAACETTLSKSVSPFGKALEHHMRLLEQANDSLSDILTRIQL